MYLLVFTCVILTFILVIKKLMGKPPKTDKDPSKNHVFSPTKLLVPISAIGYILTGIGIIAVFDKLSSGQPVDSATILMYSLIFTFSFFAYSLWCRFGVDHDKVWTKFGALFYREVRFDEVTRLGIWNAAV
ncbi:hypothetical protein [Arcanobacterium phocae]|uniref:hypothetical protein n=1 Tax=Arcanobacterium phocae TaxID=131112 RepID=UPI000B80D56C|nr:hypothetical protein [Arcanobacterium phocae]